MTFKELLQQVISGQANLEIARTWLGKRLTESDCDHAALLADLDAAAGLPGPIANAMRSQIREVAGEAPAPDAGGPDFELTLDDSPLESTPNTDGAGVDAQPAPPATDELSLELPDEPDAAATQAAAAPPADDANPFGELTLDMPAEDADKTVVAEPQDDTGSGDDDATVVNAAAETHDDDETIVMHTDGGRTVVTTGRVSDPDATVVNDADATVVSGAGEDATVRSDAGDETDPFALDQATSPGGGPTGGSWPTGTGFPGRGTGGPTTIGPGTILKDRFELVAPIGEGGMGTVYKARDLLKVEAKDRNPFIAVKLLSGDFRQHPEAFIALQRESSKAQKLAHPNIATVYDFDRDGATVYMTMELMEGEELARYIKKLPAGGLAVEDAMALIEQLCNGLSYAHARNLVHSDFKPGNAFLLKDGTLKLLDFGIARASKTRSDAEGETTVFDPGSLGALTPAYATIEMFEGEDPDPRDDIYALACVSYELLTGKHPFNKLSAVKVKEKGLKPAPVSKLTKRQNKMLLRALALDRDQRTPTVEDFWEGLRPKKSYTLQIAGGSLALIAIIGALAYGPVVNYIHTKRNNQIVAAIEQGNEAKILSELQQIKSLDKQSQQDILDAAKDKIIGYFEAKAETEVDTSKGKYDYPAALRIVDQAKQYYPDSAQVGNIQSSLEDRRNRLLADLQDKFSKYLDAGEIMPVEGEDITDVLKVLSQAAPKSPLLGDARLTKQYADLAQKAIQQHDYEHAKQILDVSLQFTPSDPTLLGLQDQVKRELKRQADARLVADLEGKIKTADGQLASVAGYDSVRDDLIKLASLRPDDPVLVDALATVHKTFSDALAQATKQQDWKTAETVLRDFAPLLGVGELIQQRRTLSQAEVEAGYQAADLADILQKLDAHHTTLTQMLAKPEFGSDWDSKLLVEFKSTIALLQPGNTWFDDLRDAIAQAYIGQAKKMIDANRFDSATDLLDTGSVYEPDLPAFASTRTALAQAKQAYDQAQAEKRRLARIDAMENNLVAQANAGETPKAIATLDELRKALPADDPFLTRTGPEAIAKAYLDLANGRAKAGDYGAALKFARGGLKIAPDYAPLTKLLPEFQRQAARSDLMDLARNATADSVGGLVRQLADVDDAFPQQRADIRKQMFGLLSTHIKDLEGTDLVGANALLDAARKAFSDPSELASIKLKQPPHPSKFAAEGRKAIAAHELSKASQLLAQGEKEEPGNADLEAFGNQLKTKESEANEYFAHYQVLMQAGQSTQAKRYLDAAIQLWNDNSDYRAEYQRNFATTTQAPIRSSNGGRPCTANLAGYGRSGRAECFDVLPGGDHGPTMVVVPAGGAFKTPFAIGKYEVSVSEYDAFCNATRQCKNKGGNGDLPVAGISIADAKAYVAWLNKESGKDYALPTDAQWAYAATANGSSQNKDFNCRVTLGDQIIKGISLVEVGTGKANAWGLVNYVGNVQEWVYKGTQLVARGGDYEDPLSTCDISLSRPASGQASSVTGLRLVRKLD